MASSEQIVQKGRRLDSWKAIAQYLHRDVRSVQRWERDRGLPIHRLPGQKGGAVFAFESELELWLRSGTPEASSSDAVVSEAKAEDTTLQTAISSQARSSNSYVRYLVILASCCVLLIGLAFAWRRGVFASAGSGAIRSIAVLPLQNLSSDPNQEYFADGMTDELITDLAQIRQLKIVSKTSVMQYKETKKALPQIGGELGVDAVVEGSVLRSGDRVRITAQLIRASTDRHLWAHAYEGDVKNVLALQARVAEAITDEVRLTLTPQERTRLQSARSYDPEAYDLYLRGRYVFARRTEPAFHEAINYFQQAAAKDAGFPHPYAGLSDCYTLLTMFGGGYAWVAEARANAAKALALDDGLAEAHTSLAAADVLAWNWTAAEKEFQRALELDPNSAQAHQWYGNLLLGPLGRHEEAIAEVKRALDLDPFSLIVNTDLGYAYFLAGQYDLAFQQYQKVLAMDPAFLPVHYDLALYYQQKGMHDKQIEELIADYKLAGRNSAADAISRVSSQPNKLFQTMAQTNGTFDQPTDEFIGSLSNSASAYAQLGRNREALAALQKSYEKHDPYMIYLKVDPSLSSLHNEPAFQDLEKKVGLISR